MLSKVKSGALQGIDGIVIDVETDISYGLPVFHMVGLPQAAVRESRERVKTAVNNCGYQFPPDRVVINLAPADIKKQGTGLDLPVAVGILAASNLIPGPELEACMFIGELSLDGHVKGVNGVLPMALAARTNKIQKLFVPFENRNEASVVNGIEVYPVRHLSQIVAFFTGHETIEPCVPLKDISAKKLSDTHPVDFSDIQGQQHAKTALKIAAAGGHHLIMSGEPGSGKSMMAKRLPTILPQLSFDEALEVTRIYSIQGMTGNDTPLISQRPFRSPHHTISDAGLIGGGSAPDPGEISLAHHGVLFLDELPEFKKNVLEVLRQPLENGEITIARAGFSAVFPARVMLICAMNPCPCGFLYSDLKPCTCTQPQVRKYRAKLSGPLLDRIDIQIEVPKVSYKQLSSTKTNNQGSASIRFCVEAARAVQAERFKGTPISCNAGMNNEMLSRHCKLDADSGMLLEKAVNTLGFSARAYHSVLKVARTIADLEKRVNICSMDVAQAIQYRSFDRS
ncbi:MAG: ATP-binding protein [Desulfobacteraceae bacterium]|nr:MAG: ATP-binding protein [Desulfobacteraceae bacterium]